MTVTQRGYADASFIGMINFSEISARVIKGDNPCEKESKNSNQD